MINNIPSSALFEIDNHACVSMASVIDNVFVHGTVCDLLRTYTIILPDINDIELSNTKGKNELVSSDKYYHSTSSVSPFIVYLILWLDDFEVNHTRKNHNSTWIKTYHRLCSDLLCNLYNITIY